MIGFYLSDWERTLHLFALRNNFQVEDQDMILSTSSCNEDASAGQPILRKIFRSSANSKHLLLRECLISRNSRNVPSGTACSHSGLFYVPVGTRRSQCITISERSMHQKHSGPERSRSSRNGNVPMDRWRSRRERSNGPRTFPTYETASLSLINNT